MSTQQLQSAILSLVRYPDKHRGEQIEAFLNNFKLSDKEKWQVRALAISPYVSRFGAEQRTKRFNNYVRGVIPVSTLLMGKTIIIDEIFNRHFEPLHPIMPVAQLAEAFCMYLIKNFKRFKKQFRLPPFLGDLLRYEFSEYSIAGYLLERNWKTPRHSYLAPGAVFLILESAWEIQSYYEKAKNLRRSEVLALPAPEKVRTLMLFVKTSKSDNSGEQIFTQFVIDDRVRYFLQSQLGQRPKKAVLPSYYSELVELGLCKKHAG